MGHKRTTTKYNASVESMVYVKRNTDIRKFEQRRPDANLVEMRHHITIHQQINNWRDYQLVIQKQWGEQPPHTISQNFQRHGQHLQQTKMALGSTKRCNITNAINLSIITSEGKSESKILAEYGD